MHLSQKHTFLQKFPISAYAFKPNRRSQNSASSQACNGIVTFLCEELRRTLLGRILQWGKHSLLHGRPCKVPRQPCQSNDRAGLDIKCGHSEKKIIYSLPILLFIFLCFTIGKITITLFTSMLISTQGRRSATLTRLSINFEQDVSSFF